MQKERLVFYYKVGLKAILVQNLSLLNLFNESVNQQNYTNNIFFSYKIMFFFH